MTSYKNIFFLVLLISLVVSSCKSQSQHSPEVGSLLTNTKSNMIFVEGGTFIMGHPEVRGATRTHEVTLDGYSINKHETTFEEYDIYTKTNNLDSITPNWRDQKGMGPKYGAWGMTWQEAKDYCQWLGQQLNLPIDLPTEAQWEYAARSRGLNVQHATNNGKIEGSYTEKRNYEGDNQPVGTFPPNPLGLYDMSGGKAEWTLDWYAAYPKTPQTNPVMDSIDIHEKKVVRGVHTLVNSVYQRRLDKPTSIGADVGIRCVCNQKTPIN